MGYSCRKEVKILRSKHRVTFHEHTTVKQLIDDLKHIPENATFDEMEWCADERGGHEISYIEFHHEKVDPVQPERE